MFILGCHSEKGSIMSEVDESPAEVEEAAAQEADPEEAAEESAEEAGEEAE
jgi:hypothetical protein